MSYILTEEQRRQLNDIFTGVVKKYKVFSTESHVLDSPKRLEMDEARELAEAELTGRRNKIENTYDERVAEITANATARGMLNSSTTIELLDKAYVRKQDALERLENLCEKLAKKILADNAKIAQNIEKEKSHQRSRSLRDLIAGKNMTLKHPWTSTIVQNAIDDELYYAYQQWLMRFDLNTAYEYVAQNNLFFHNMGSSRRNALLSDMNNRRMVL